MAKTLQELRKITEKGYNQLLIHRTFYQAIIVFLDKNQENTNNNLIVLRYVKKENWGCDIRYEGDDYVCALDEFQEYLDCDLSPTLEGLKFICPECGKNKLECCEDGPYVSEILRIDEEGDFGYGAIDASGAPERIQCSACGFTLLDGKWHITDNEEVVEWIRENCNQD